MFTLIKAYSFCNCSTINPTYKAFGCNHLAKNIFLLKDLLENINICLLKTVPGLTLLSEIIVIVCFEND